MTEQDPPTLRLYEVAALLNVTVERAPIYSYGIGLAGDVVGVVAMILGTWLALRGRLAKWPERTLGPKVRWAMDDLPQTVLSTSALVTVALFLAAILAWIRRWSRSTKVTLAILAILSAGLTVFIAVAISM